MIRWLHDIEDSLFYASLSASPNSVPRLKSWALRIGLFADWLRQWVEKINPQRSRHIVATTKRCRGVFSPWARAPLHLRDDPRGLVFAAAPRRRAAFGCNITHVTARAPDNSTSSRAQPRWRDQL